MTTFLEDNFLLNVLLYHFTVRIDPCSTSLPSIGVRHWRKQISHSLFPRQLNPHIAWKYPRGTPDPLHGAYANRPLFRQPPGLPL